jgi:hypothetical protein
MKNRNMKAAAACVLIAVCALSATAFARSGSMNSTDIYSGVYGPGEIAPASPFAATDAGSADVYSGVYGPGETAPTGPFTTVDTAADNQG